MKPLFHDARIDGAVQVIWDYLTVHEEPELADAIFIFGSVDPRVPKYAAELYRKKYASVILVSGHMGPSAKEIHGRAEYEVISDILTEQGVPESAILIEPRATNTGENVLFGMDVLRRDSHDPKKILFVSKPYHSRRCLMTFAKKEPKILVRSCPPPGDPSLFIPFTKERFAMKLVGEVDRLLAYPKEGYILPLEIPPDVLVAAAVIRDVFGKGEHA